MSSRDRLPPRRKAKRSSKKPRVREREPVPGELERDAESWSGPRVYFSCLGVVGLLVLGYAAWSKFYAIGAAGVLMTIFGVIADVAWHIHKKKSK